MKSKVTKRKRFIHNKTKSKTKLRRGGVMKITEDEQNKCSAFCKNNYVNKYIEKMKDTYKTNPYLMKLNKTDKEIEQLAKNVNKEDKIRDCKSIYCNPKCTNSYVKTNKSLRYVCPLCKKKNWNKVKNLGAITYCEYDTTYE